MKEFISLFAKIFDETDPSEITAETEFKNLNEWSSLTALSLIALAEEEFGVTITGKDIKNAQTVNDLHSLITSRRSN